MSPIFIIGIVCVILLIIIVAVAITTSALVTPAVKTTVKHTPASRQYTFYQGLDSKDGDIKQDTANANNAVALQAACDIAPGCVAFNTNGWLKSSISPRNIWTYWSGDAAQGMYVLNGTQM